MSLEHKPKIACYCQFPKKRYDKSPTCYYCWQCRNCAKRGCDLLYRTGSEQEQNRIRREHIMSNSVDEIQNEFADKVKRKQEAEASFAKVNDSGERRKTSTGAVRDRAQGKGRFELISPIAMKRLAQHYENGARKYSSRNWEKGMPLSWFIDSAIRHLYSYLAGDRSEDHIISAAWNAFGFVHIEQLIRQGKLPKELDDIGATDRPLVEQEDGNNKTSDK